MATQLTLDEICVRDTTLTLKELTTMWKREVGQTGWAQRYVDRANKGGKYV